VASVIVLINFTDQGIRNVKQTTERAKVATTEAEKLGIEIKDIYRTPGQYDASTRRRNEIY
jgi:uncharacterized protein with GYD domain